MLSARTPAISCAALAVSLSLPAQAADKAPLELEPSSQWRLDYDKDSCRLARIFGEGDNRTAFYMERYGPGDNFFMVVAGKSLGKLKTRPTKIAFGPNGAMRKDQDTYGDFSTFGPAVMVSDMSILSLSHEDSEFDPNKIAQDTNIFGQELTAAQEKEIQWLDVKPPSKNPIRLKTGSMGPPLAAMRKCTDDLLTRWGHDLDELRGMTRRAVPTKNPANWLRTSDYPAGALSKGEQGIIHFRLTVGPDGKPQSCHIQQKTKPAGFDDIVCSKLTKRAEFHPALGENGKPITSFYQNTVRFQVAK